MDRNETMPTSYKLNRIIIIVAFYAIQLPLVFARGPNGQKPYNSEIAIIFTSFFIFYLLLDILELFVPAFFKLRGYKGLFLRLLPIIISLIFSRIEIHLFLAIPICIYYAAIELKLAVNIIFFLVVFVLNFFIEHFFRDWGVNMDEESRSYLFIFILIFRTAKLLFMWIVGSLGNVQIREFSDKTKLIDQLNESNKQIKIYADKVADTVAVEERNRLAQEIHDSIGHYLTAIQIQLSKALVFFDKDSEASKKAITDSRNAASDAMKDVRLSLKSIKEPDEDFFYKSMDKIVDRIKHNDIDITYSIEQLPECNYGVLMALYRVAQESSTNMMKHSGATEASLKIYSRDNMVFLSISDNGEGFDTSREYSGYGLKGLSSRMELIRGVFKIESKKGKGTIIEAFAPLEPSLLEN